MMSFVNYIRELIGNDLLFGLIVSVAIILTSFLLAKILSFLLKRIIKPFTAKSKTILDDKILEVAESATFRLIIIGGFYLAIGNLREGYFLFEENATANFAKAYPYINKMLVAVDYVLYIAFVFILLLLTYRIITIVFDWYADKINAGENRDLSGSLFPLFKKVAKIIIAALAVVIVLSKFNVDISAFIVSLGVGSLAIALAAQDTLSNMIAGFIIMVDRPFRIGDRINYAAGETGDVVSIGLRSTKILNFDSNLVIMPNNEIVKSKIVNVTYPNILTRVIIEVGIAYGSDLKKVREIMLKAANDHSLISQEIPPDVVLIAFGDSSLNVRLAARTDDYRNAWTMQCELRETIYEEFNKAGVEIPFPQRVVHMKKDT
ncbi:MAG: mechanosensitive ion channel domain-containing protein [Ignavibacteriaceae bacterium]